MDPSAVVRIYPLPGAVGMTSSDEQIICPSPVMKDAEAPQEIGQQSHGSAVNHSSTMLSASPVVSSIASVGASSASSASSSSRDLSEPSEFSVAELNAVDAHLNDSLAFSFNPSLVILTLILAASNYTLGTLLPSAVYPHSIGLAFFCSWLPLLFTLSLFGWIGFHRGSRPLYTLLRDHHAHTFPFLRSQGSKAHTRELQKVSHQAAGTLKEKLQERVTKDGWFQRIKNYLQGKLNAADFEVSSQAKSMRHKRSLIGAKQRELEELKYAVASGILQPVDVDTKELAEQWYRNVHEAAEMDKSIGAENAADPHWMQGGESSSHSSSLPSAAPTIRPSSAPAGRDPVFSYEHILQVSVVPVTLGCAWIAMSLLLPPLFGLQHQQFQQGLVNYGAKVTDRCLVPGLSVDDFNQTSRQAPEILALIAPLEFTFPSPCSTTVTTLYIGCIWFLIVISLVFALGAPWTPALSTAAIIQRRIEEGERQFIGLARLRNRAIEYERTERHRVQESMMFLQPSGILLFLVVGLVQVAMLYLGLGYSLQSSVSPLSDQLGLSCFWIAMLVATLVFGLAGSCLFMFALTEYNKVVISSKLRFGYFAYLLQPGVLEKQLWPALLREASAEQQQHRLPEGQADSLDPELHPASCVVASVGSNPWSRRIYLLRTWCKARMLLQEVDVNFQMQGASWVVGCLVLLTLVLTIVFVVCLLKTGSMWSIPTLPLMLSCGCVLAVIALAEVLLIIQIFRTTELQLQTLAEMRCGLDHKQQSAEEAKAGRGDPKPESKTTSTVKRRTPVTLGLKPEEPSSSAFASVEDRDSSGSIGASDFRSFLDDLIKFLQENDVPPRVLGVAVRPTFLQVLQVYLVSGATTIGGVIISNYA